MVRDERLYNFGARMPRGWITGLFVALFPLLALLLAAALSNESLELGLKILVVGFFLLDFLVLLVSALGAIGKRQFLKRYGRHLTLKALWEVRFGGVPYPFSDMT